MISADNDFLISDSAAAAWCGAVMPRQGSHTGLVTLRLGHAHVR